jgi:hypothetical protein
MNLRRALSVAAGLLLAAAGVVGVSQPASATLPLPLPVPSTCLIQRYNTGNFLTAVGGGGQTTDVIHTNATALLDWEKFNLVPIGDWFAIQTIDRHFLTAVGGGGQVNDVIHSNATGIGAWELFRFTCITETIGGGE